MDRRAAPFISSTYSLDDYHVALRPVNDIATAIFRSCKLAAYFSMVATVVRVGCRLPTQSPLSDEGNSEVTSV